jgi:hypothetical protein
MFQRHAWYSADDSQLLAQCEVDTYRASGPGGQKRNKTSSAVRLRHLPSGLIVISEDSRSQHENKAKALRRLRRQFVLKLREPVLDGVGEHPAIAAIREGDAFSGSESRHSGRFHVPSAKDPRYWPAVAIVLDVLETCGAQVSEAAKRLDTSTANLLSLLELEPRAWDEANILRRKFGQKPLRPGS